MNLGFPEMLFLFLLALLLFGPKKLPEIGRQVGKALAEFKRASNELKGQLENEMRLLETEGRENKPSPPPQAPENTVAATTEAPAAPSTPATTATPASEPHSSAASGVEGA